MTPDVFDKTNEWKYNIDDFDLKFIVNYPLTDKIIDKLISQDAQIFWLSFFKSRAAVTADDFLNALE